MKKQNVKCLEQFQLLSLIAEEQKKVKGGEAGDIIIIDTVGT